MFYNNENANDNEITCKGCTAAEPCENEKTIADKLTATTETLNKASNSLAKLLKFIWYDEFKDMPTDINAMDNIYDMSSHINANLNLTGIISENLNIICRRLGI